MSHDGLVQGLTLGRRPARIRPRPGSDELARCGSLHTSPGFTGVERGVEGAGKLKGVGWMEQSILLPGSESCRDQLN